MTSKHVSYIMAGILSLLILAILGSAYVANGLLEKTSGRLVDLKLKSQVLQEEQTSLVKAKKDIEKYRELEKIAKTIVPQDKDQARAVREIVKIANESGISPSSITFPASNLGSNIPGTAAASGAPAAGAAPTAAAGRAASKLTQLTPVKGFAGLYVLQITITQDAASPVAYDQFISFLQGLENNRRTAQVSNIVLQPSPQDKNKLSFTLTVDEYIKP